MIDLVANDSPSPRIGFQVEVLFQGVCPAVADIVETSKKSCNAIILDELNEILFSVFRQFLRHLRFLSFFGMWGDKPGYEPESLASLFPLGWGSFAIYLGQHLAD
jgi:hypothetical protein